MTVQLCEDTKRTLTDRVYNQWKESGYTDQPHVLTWLEVNNLTGNFLKLCAEQNRDYREFDFINMLDHKLNYYENLAGLDNQLNPEPNEKEAANKFQDYLTEQQLKEYTPQQKDIIQSLESEHKTLTKKIGQLTKKLDNQEMIDPDALRKELDEMQRVQTQIYARLEQIPNLNQLILALEKSENFRSIGDAIRPITANLPQSPQPPAKPKNHFTLSGWLKTKHIAALDLFAAIVVTVMFAGASYGIIGWLSFTCWGIIGLSTLWLTYVVVVRLVAGGILN